MGMGPRSGWFAGLTSRDSFNARPRRTPLDGWLPALSRELHPRRSRPGTSSVLDCCRLDRVAAERPGTAVLALAHTCQRWTSSSLIGQQPTRSVGRTSVRAQGRDWGVDRARMRQCLGHGLSQRTDSTTPLGAAHAMRCRRRNRMRHAGGAAMEAPNEPRPLNV